MDRIWGEKEEKKEKKEASVVRTTRSLTLLHSQAFTLIHKLAFKFKCSEKCLFLTVTNGPTATTISSTTAPTLLPLSPGIRDEAEHDDDDDDFWSACESLITVSSLTLVCLKSRYLLIPSPLKPSSYPSFLCD